MIAHILEREMIHLFSSPGVYLLMLLLSEFLRRKWGWWKWHCPQGWMAYILPAMACFIFISFREVWDVTKANPDPVFKSVVDWTVWMSGLGLSIWGIYRMTPELQTIKLVITARQDARKRSELE